MYTKLKKHLPIIIVRKFSSFPEQLSVKTEHIGWTNGGHFEIKGVAKMATRGLAGTPKLIRYTEPRPYMDSAKKVN